METLNIKEACELVKVHPTTLLSRVMSGEIRAAKIGKKWIFIKEDLLEDIKKFYYKKKTFDKTTGEVKWQSINQKATNIGALDLPLQTDTEYNAVLARTTKKKPSNYTTN